MRGYAKSGVVEQVRAAGGEVFAVTSEPQSLADEATRDWDLPFQCVGDPHHEVLADCRRRGWMNLFTQDAALLQKSRSWASHLKGYFQPGVLVVAHDERVLYRWRCRPVRANAGGAAVRPTPQHVWSRVQAFMQTEGGDAPLDADPQMDHPPVPWALSVLLLLAHGWFVRPKPFPLGRADDVPSPRPDAMFPRLAGFCVLWIMAFLLLPLTWVSVAFGFWLALITPGVIEIHREFQNVPEGEPAED